MLADRLVAVGCWWCSDRVVVVVVVVVFFVQLLLRSNQILCSVSFFQTNSSDCTIIFFLERHQRNFTSIFNRAG